MTQIASIHTQMVSAAAMQAAFREQWPETSVVNILDEELFHSPAKGQDYVARQFTVIAAYAADGGADSILLTCSAFTAAIGRVKAVLAPLPELAPNEALIEEAVASGRVARDVRTDIGCHAQRVPSRGSGRHGPSRWSIRGPDRPGNGTP